MNRDLFAQAQILKYHGQLLELWSCFEDAIFDVFSKQPTLSAVIQINGFIEKYNPIAKQIERYDKTTPFKVVIKPNDKFEPYLRFQREFLTDTYNRIAKLCNKYQIPRPEELPVL